jgi:hypothetical protein
MYSHVGGRLLASDRFRQVTPAAGMLINKQMLSYNIVKHFCSAEQTKHSNQFLFLFIIKQHISDKCLVIRQHVQ